MSTNPNNRVTVRLFLGSTLTSELRMHLKQSKSWQQTSILPLEDSHRLLEVHHQGKDYIGYYLSREKMTLSDLKESISNVKKALKSHALEYNAELLRIYIFPQLFIA